MRKTLLLYPAALLATFRACRDWLVDCRDSLTDDGWREGDDLGANIGRWIARSYAFRFLMFFVTVIMFGIGLAVTEFAKPYTGESAAMVIGLSALFAPLIAWVWIGYFRDPPESAAEFRGRRAAAAEQCKQPRFKDSTPRSDKPWQEQQQSAAEFRARRAAAAEQCKQPFKDSTPRSDKPWQEQQHGHHIDTMPVEAPLSAIEYPPALPEVETVKDKADAGPAYRAR